MRVLKKDKTILYLVNQFPKLSETFVKNELKAIMASGLTTKIWSVKASNDQIVHEDVKQLMPHVSYPLTEKFTRSTKIRAVATLFFRNPIRFIRAHRVIKKLQSPPPRHLLRNTYVLADHCLTSNVAHIHSHFAKTAARQAMLISILTGIPCSVTCHAFDIFPPNPLLEDVLYHVTFIVTISAFNKKYLARKFPESEGKIHIIHCGIEEDRIVPAVAFRGLVGESPLRLFSAGRLVEKKGMTFLLKACARLVQSGIPIQCEIAGDGPLEEQLNKETNDLGISDSVTFLGAVEQNIIWEKITACDIFVLPVVVAASGDMDGIPVAIMEAIATGKPVISSAVSGIPELLADIGWLCSERNPEEIARAVNQILTLDEAQVKKRLTRGLERIKNDFSQRAESEKLINLFKPLMNRG